MRELADFGGVIRGAGSADDARGVRGVRLPERRLGDPVRLGDDPLGKAEGLEGLDCAGLDTVGLANGEPPGAALHDARGDTWELGQLRGREHAGRPGADNQHIDLLRKLSWPVDADSCCRLDPRVPGYVTVMVKLHRFLTSL